MQIIDVGCFPNVHNAPTAYQRATGSRYGECGCNQWESCMKHKNNAGTRATRSILSHPLKYSPFCNQLCTGAYEQDQWRDHYFLQDKNKQDRSDWQYRASSVSQPDKFRQSSSWKTQAQRDSTCAPCEEYHTYMKKIEKDAFEHGHKGSIRHPIYSSPPARIMEEVYCDDLNSLRKRNKKYMCPAPCSVADGAIQELGTLPIITLHKMQQKMEDRSGLFYPDERGLARVCNPVGSSYLTAKPYRCNPIYRVCEGVNLSFDGHVPGEQFEIGKPRGTSTRNALKYMTYRV